MILSLNSYKYHKTIIMSTFYVRYTFSNECELFSDMFQTRTEACDYADYIRDINQNENSRVEVFKQENLLTDYGYKQTYTSNNKFSDNYSDNISDNISDTNEPNFTGMTYQEYGKGFLLTPPDNHPDYGTKYYHNGWWMPSQNGWFFKSKFFSTIVNNGASSSTSLGSKTTKTKTFSGMTYSKYGKGYLLTAPSNHTDYGTKYYHNGWWMPTQDAWFFKSKYKSYLKDNGASRTSN